MIFGSLHPEYIKNDLECRSSYELTNSSSTQKDASKKLKNNLLLYRLVQILFRDTSMKSDKSY